MTRPTGVLCVGPIGETKECERVARQRLEYLVTTDWERRWVNKRLTTT